MRSQLETWLGSRPWLPRLFPRPRSTRYLEYRTYMMPQCKLLTKPKVGKEGKV